jgi:hypothetical protein
LVTSIVLGFALGRLAAGDGIQGPHPKTVWKPQRAFILNGIAEDVYGHSAYVRLIAVYNRVPSDEPVPANTTIRTPTLPDLFKDVGLFPKYTEQFTRIFNAVAEYRVFLPKYREVREKASGYSKGGTMDLPEGMQKQLFRFAAEIELSHKELRSLSKKGGSVPEKMLGQFSEAVSILRRLATGNVDGYGYDQDMVEQRVARGLANAVAWSRE